MSKIILLFLLVLHEFPKLKKYTKNHGLYCYIWYQFFFSLHFLFYILVTATASSHPHYALACLLIFLVPLLGIYSFLQYSQNYLKHGNQIMLMSY